MGLIFIKLILGLALITLGANYLVDSAVAIAKRFNLPDIVIGMTLVALGTSAPEITVSLIGAFEGSSDIALGNVIGSNVCNILLVLGLSTLIYPLTISKLNRIIDAPMLLFITLLTIILGTNGSAIRDIIGNSTVGFNLTYSKGIFLILIGIVFLLYNYYLAREEHRKNMNDQADDKIKVEPPIEGVSKLFAPFFYKKFFLPVVIFAFALSCLILVVGGNMFVGGAKMLATSIGMSEMAIAVTILAVGTSLPELATSIVAAFKRNSGIALGNVIGSNILNIGFALGGSAMVLPTHSELNTSHLSFFLLSPLLLVIFALIGKKKHYRIFGLFYIIFYILYIAKVLV